MATNDDKAKPRNLLGWRGEVAATQAQRGLTPDPVPARVTTITAPGEARAPALIRDALNPQNAAAARAEAMPFAGQVSGPRFAPDGTGRRQGGVPQAAPAQPAPSPKPITRAAPAVIPAAAATAVPKGMADAGAPRPADVPPPTGMRFNEGRATDVQPPTQPSIGYFIGGDGKRRDLTGNQAQALAGRPTTVPAGAGTPSAGSFSVSPAVAPGIMTAAAQQTPAPLLQRPNAVALGRDAAAVQRSEAAATNRAASAFLNPMSNQAEMLRRLENSQSSYFNKGSPSARAFAAEAILGQLRAGNAAEATRQQQVGQTVAGAATQEANLGAAEAEAGAARADAGQARQLAATLQREELDASAPVLQLQGGTTARLGRDGVARSIVGEDGKPVRGQADAKSLDPNEIFKAVTAAQQAILTDPTLTPEARDSAMQQLESTPAAQAVAALLSSPSSAQASQSGPRPSMEQFMSAARAANPGASDEALRTYYQQTYGSTP